MITFLPPFWRRDALGHSHPYLASLTSTLALEGRWEGGHDLCPSSLEERVRVATVTPILWDKERRKVCMTYSLSSREIPLHSYPRSVGLTTVYTGG